MGGVHIYVHSCKNDHHFIISIVVIIFEVDNILPTKTVGLED